MRRRSIVVAVDGRELELTNLEKVLYPRAGFTKAEVIDYYRRVAAVMLPHLRGRPVTLKRWPDGVEAPSFFEKQCPRHRPPWVRVAPVASSGKRPVVEYCRIDDLPALVWVANLAALELHVTLGTADAPDTPRAAVFDLDPGPPAGLRECAVTALRIRSALERRGLQAFAKASGKSGLHVYVPINAPATFEETRALARGVARELEAETPQAVTTVMRKELREGKVFIDWSQNHARKTTIAVYSLRGTAEPRASTPLRWDEVEELAASGPERWIERLRAERVLERVEREGDIFAPVLELRQPLASPQQ
jgi:bifunctional non-homologous end joining protein LigD